MRAAAFTAVLFAATLVISSCGSSSTTTNAGHATPAGNGVTQTLASAASFRPPTTHQASAFAHAVNIRAADVPDFRVVTPEHEHESAREKRIEHEMLRCVGRHGAGHALVEASSKEFGREGPAFKRDVQSEVSVEGSAAAANKELVAIRSAHARECFTHYLDLLFQGPEFRGAHISPVSIAADTPPAPGATGSFAWRIKTAVSGAGIDIRLYIDVLGFVYGPAEVVLFASGVPQPFPASEEQRLFSLLLERTKTHTV